MPRIKPNTTTPTSSVGPTGGATTTTPKPGATNLADSGSTVAGGLAHTAPAAQHGDPSKIINDLAAKAKANGEKIVDIIKKPTAQSSVSATFRFQGEGRMLKPGEQLLLQLP